MGTAGSPGSWQIGALRLDGRSGELVSRHGSTVVPEKPLSLLLALLERPGDLVTREELRHRLWPDGIFVDFEDGLNHVVRELREILADDARHPAFVETVPRRGYRYVGPVQRVGDRPTNEPGQGRWGRTWPRLGTALALAGALLVASDTPGGRFPSPVGGAPGIRSIAVRPFANLSVAPAGDDLARGTTEALLAGPGRRGDLRARASLPVGTPLPSRTVRPEAQALYLKGRYLHHRWPEDHGKAAELLERAVAEDPRHAAAWATLALCYGNLAFFNPPREYQEKARRAVRRALDLDERSAAAHSALARLKQCGEWDWPGAESEYRRALELDPGSAESHLGYSSLLAALGRFEEALVEARRGVELDPVSPLASVQPAWVLMMARRYDEAVGEYQRAQDLDTSSRMAQAQMAWCRTFQGRFAEAFALFDRLGRRERDPHLGYLHAQAGRRTEALAIARSLEEYSQTHYVDPLGPIVLYGALGEGDRAFAWLDRALDERAPDLFGIAVDPFVDTLRDDPRFAGRLKRMGLGHVRLLAGGPPLDF